MERCEKSKWTISKDNQEWLLWVAAILFLFGILVSLSGCTFSHEARAMQACDESGFSRGTQSYIDCIAAFEGGRPKMGLMLSPRVAQ